MSEIVDLLTTTSVPSVYTYKEFPMPNTDPLVQTLKVQVDPVAAGADSQSVVGEAPFAGTVTRVVYVPAATLTGANTNSRSHQLTNRGQSGAGTTAVSSLAFVSGVNAAADAEKTETLSGTPANVAVAQGDVLTFDSTHVGTGLADPGGVVLVDITRGDVSS